jgi:tetratricopeptide (TPR) repeat protein
MRVTKAILLGFVLCSLMERAYAGPARTIRGLVISTNGTLIPEFAITVKDVSLTPGLFTRKRFKNGEFTISGLTEERYQFQIDSPLHIPKQVVVDFESDTRLTQYSIVILHSYRNERQLTPDTEYTVSIQALQEKVPAKAKEAYMKAVSLHREGRLQEAVVEYASALRLYPNYVRALEDLGAILIFCNQPNLALQFLRRAHNIEDQNIIVNLNMGLALGVQGDYSGAIKSLKSVLNQYPRLALIHYYIARIYAVQKKYADAEESIRKAIENDPQMMEALMLMIDISLQQQKHDQAREGLLQVREAAGNKRVSQFIDETLAMLGSKQVAHEQSASSQP